MVHILSGSVSFRKGPIPTQVLVFCETERNHKNLLTVYWGLWYYVMAVYDRRKNSFYWEILYACKNGYNNVYILLIS